jgi:hypothetical protein
LIKTSKYIEAFLQITSFKKEDIEVKTLEEGCCIVKAEDNIFRVDSEESMESICRNILSDPFSAQDIPLNTCLELMDGIELEADFLFDVIANMHINEKKEKIESLGLALNMANFSKEKMPTFWKALYETQDFDLYGRFIVEAAKMSNMDELILDLFSLITADGINQFNQLEDGVFEEIILNEDTKEEAMFFIYSLDFSFWEVLEENTSIEHSV